MCQQKTTRTWKTSSSTARSGSSYRGPMPRSLATLPRAASRRPRPSFAGTSTGSRSRSSLPRPASPPSVSRAWPPASTTASDCSRAAAGRRCPVTRRCARRSTGATSCCPNPTGRSCAGWGSSSGPLRWTQPAPSRRAPTSPLRRSSIRSRAWWASHSCPRMLAARSCTIVCWRRRAPTHAKSSSRAPSSTTSRDATPSTFKTSSSVPTPSSRPGRPPSGSLPIGRTSTTCAWPSTGPSRGTATSALAWRSPRQPCRCGRTCRCWLNVAHESSKPLKASDVRCRTIRAATCACISRSATRSCIPARAALLK